METHIRTPGLVSNYLSLQLWHWHSCRNHLKKQLAISYAIIYNMSVDNIICGPFVDWKMAIYNKFPLFSKVLYPILVGGQIFVPAYTTRVSGIGDRFYCHLIINSETYQLNLHRWCSNELSDSITAMGSCPWWRHEMEKKSVLLAICAGNSPLTGEFPTQRPVTWGLDVFFDLRQNKRLSKKWWGWWFETPSRPLWRHCNDTVLTRLVMQWILSRELPTTGNLCIPVDDATQWAHDAMITSSWRQNDVVTSFRRYNDVIIASAPMKCGSHLKTHFLNTCKVLSSCCQIALGWIP